MPETRALPETSQSSDTETLSAEVETSTSTLWPQVEAIAGNILEFGKTYWWVGLIVMSLLVGLFVVYRLARRRQKNIQKLWLYTLYFLQKRQMLIPLVVSLSRKDGFIDSTTQKTLLDIRDRCREVPFRRHPVDRLVLEKEVSEILFTYFTSLAEKDVIKSGTKFEKIMRDLEFIDTNLVKLQKTYNTEARRWNRLVSYPVLGALLTLFGLRQQEPFDV